MKKMFQAVRSDFGGYERVVINEKTIFEAIMKIDETQHPKDGDIKKVFFFDLV